MTDKKFRLQFPYPPSGSDYSAGLYWPDPVWYTHGSNDHPTVSQILPCTDSSMTLKMVEIADGSESYMNSNTAYAGYSVSNGGNIWRWDPSSKPTISGTTNPYAMCIGHKGPASSNSTVQSWQKGVIGVAMEHKDTPASGKYGHYIQDCVLLYRKPNNWDQFYSVTIISNDSQLPATKKNYANQTPFKTNNPRRDGSQGGLYVALEETHPARNMIVTGNYVFQGLYMRWGSYDGNSQFQGKLELWNFRLIFNTSRISDDGSRVCMPKMWQYQAAHQGWDLKLTH